MKSKLILCLALVLNGGLFGCATKPSGALSDSSEGKLFSNKEAVCLKSDDSARSWQLKYAMTEDMWDEQGLFATVHERISNLAAPEYDPEFTAAIYVKVGDKFKLLKRLPEDEDSGGSCYLKPNFIWASPKGEDRKRLIQITELFYGTGALTQEHIFTPVYGLNLEEHLTNGESIWNYKIKNLEEVEFIPAWESYQFGKDECLWKGESSTLTDDGLFFEFIVWKYENKTNVPVGKVTGTYKLERKPDGKLRIIMDKFKREPITDSGS
jgi:hypothetical protein